MVEVPLLHHYPGDRGYLLRPFLVAEPMNFHFIALVDRGGGLRHDMSATLRAAPPLATMKLEQFNGYRRNSIGTKGARRTLLPTLEQQGERASQTRRNPT
jgi:hypothetical protein